MILGDENLAQAFLDDKRALPTKQETGTVTPFFQPAKSEAIEVSEGPQPWHKTLAHLLLDGYTNEDAAQALGKSLATVVHVKTTSWFRELVSHIAITQFKGDPSKLIETASIEAVLTLEQIARAGKTESSRVSAAKTLLDAYMRNKDPMPKAPKTADPRAREHELDRQLEETERALGMRGRVEE